MINLNRLTLMLESGDLSRMLAFYTDVLGFECVARRPEDAPCWISLRHGDLEVMFTGRNEHRREFAANAQPLLTGSLYFNTDQVEAWWERLRTRATVEYPLETFDYGMREFAIRDDCGYLLQFGQDVAS